jgi:glycine/D-amino acid oxidase-like deaminating enzyme
MHLAAEGSVREVIGFIKDAAIDCDLREVPMLIVSTNPTCDRRVRRDLAAAEKMGLTCYSALSRSELRERVNSPLLSSGYEDHVSGLVNPLKLVRGLADHLVSRGLSLFEHTPVRSLDTRSRPLALRTPTGTVSADRVLLARNAWSAQHRPFRRMVTPFYVYQAVTEPLSEADWRSVGWRGGEGVLDRRYFLIDFRPTADGRILFGGRDARQPYAARISASLDRSPAVLRLLRESFEQTFPQLRGLKFESFYGGPIAMTPNLLPQVGTLGDGRLAYSHGYCGHGMAQSNFCARIAVDLLMDRQNEDVSLPFVNRSLRGYPPEPLRWLGGWAARAEGRWNDDAAQLGRVSRDEPRLLKLANKLFA